VSDRLDASTDGVISFGPFRLIPSQRQLLQDGKPVRLGGRALDILIALGERANETVSQRDLIAIVWPNTFVEESNLRVHISAVRRALGEGKTGIQYIANIAGRGYRLLVPVAQAGKDERPARPAPRVHDLPVPYTSMLGRGDIVDSIARQLPQRRFVTVVGPGGIGKTRVALAVAERLSGNYRDGVYFVDLAPLTDSPLVLSAVAIAFGLEISSSDAVSALTAYLRDKKILLVLDSCEQVIEATASLTEQLLRGAPGVHILATSREAMRADGERVLRLTPLGVPDESADLTAAEAMMFPAIQLFVERATESLDTFELTDADAAVVADICRRLDGMALAIELAAGRVDAFGLRQLASLLDNRFKLLTRGRRTALPRHQTLSATLDWSYEVLAETERAILRRLSVFSGGFTLDAAQAVARNAEVDGLDVDDVVATLVAKSLVDADLRGEDPLYRLLDTTRVYALEKLRDGGEYSATARRHAEYYRDLLAQAEVESESKPHAEWLAIHGRHIDNVRAALNWAFALDGDSQVGVALTVAAVPLWVQLSLLGECRERAGQALARLGGSSTATVRLRMQLSAALGWSLMYGVGRAREAGPAWTTTLQLADQLDDRDYRLRALWGLCIDQFNNGEFRKALEFAHRFVDAAGNSTDAIDLTMGNRLLATSLHYLGDQKGARRHIDRVLAHLAELTLKSQIVRFRFDLRVSTHYFQARILWLQGFADQALRTVEHNIVEGRASGHALTFCSVLGQGACPITLLAGDLDAAERHCDALLEHTERHPIRLWHLWACCFRGIVMVRRGKIAAGLAILRSELERAGEARFLPRFLLPLGELAASLGEAGEIAQGLATVNETLVRCQARDERWYVAELMRIKGVLLLQEAEHRSVSAAEQCFGEALEVARDQGALFWELRSALSLARLRIGQHRPGDARAVLAPVYEKFTEGFEIADLRAARALLDSL
jgi:predicted ATPase/DNA-binding winged helix-turn-helix (wHTH) protein